MSMFSFTPYEEEFILKAAEGDNAYVRSELEDDNNNMLFRHSPSRVVSEAVCCAIVNSRFSTVKLFAGNPHARESGAIHTALLTGSTCGQFDIIKFILADYAEIYNSKTISESIMNASGNGHENVVLLLISLAKTHQLELDLSRAIDAATRMEETRIIQILQENPKKFFY